HSDVYAAFTGGIHRERSRPRHNDRENSRRVRGLTEDILFCRCSVCDLHRDGGEGLSMKLRPLIFIVGAGAAAIGGLLFSVAALSRRCLPM
ncbi:hypothetical protein, partial [Rhizobium sp. J15]|uniref:hypothetical protein n=1 Tax=Rhizobium sp. J15 TaxID=2035450 RepID=UPI001FE173AA